MSIITIPKGLRYYDLRRHWTRRIMPHLADRELNAILLRDFNKFTYGRWRLRFRPGDLPCHFESCDWSSERPRPHPRFWAYVKHSACHWLVNFDLRLATLAEPDRPWRILTSDRHCTVWDGARTLFDFNFLAFGISPNMCFQLANETELPVGKPLRVGYAPHYTDEDSSDDLRLSCGVPPIRVDQGRSTRESKADETRSRSPCRRA
jgi:hypothetical protein